MAVGLNGTTHQLGVGATTVRLDPRFTVVHRQSPLLDLRINTGDSGLTLGWSDRLYVQPHKEHPAAPRPEPRGFCLPWRWRMAGGRGTRTLGLAYTAFPSLRCPDGQGSQMAIFLAAWSAGASADVSRVRQSLHLGLERRTEAWLSPQGNWIYRLCYDSRRPTEVTFEQEERR